MSRGAWSVVGSVDPIDLADSSLELHWAAQVVASAGQTFVEPRPDDSHRAMRWDFDQRALVSDPFAGSYPFRVALRPADLTLVLLDRTGEALGSLPLAGATRDDAYDWLGIGLATYMGHLPHLERPEYEMPGHPVAAGLAFGAGHERELGVLSTLYASAAELLEAFVSGRDDASPVRCWPHRFDISTRITVERDGDGRPTKTVGAGLAPRGGGYDSWYWYVTPTPRPDAADLPAIVGPGSWHTDGWTGAVLSARELLTADEAFREAMVRKFLDVSVEAAIRVLRGSAR